MRLGVPFFNIIDVVMSELEDKYADIRPYNDSEVTASLTRLINDNAFIDVIAKYNLPGFLSAMPFIARPLVKSQLRKNGAKLAPLKTYKMKWRNI